MIRLPLRAALAGMARVAIPEEAFDIIQAKCFEEPMCHVLLERRISHPDRIMISVR